MINNRPNNKNYHNGNYIPINKEKLLKLNSEGGVYYRSGLEKKMMIWLDSSPNITKWGAECLSIPYKRNHYLESGFIEEKNHTYYVDFVYELKNPDGTKKTVVAEVKSHKEYLNTYLLSSEKFNPLKDKSNPNSKQLKNAEYDMKEAQKNLAKWATMIEWCDKKGYDFIVITEEHFKKLGL